MGRCVGGCFFWGGGGGGAFSSSLYCFSFGRGVGVLYVLYLQPEAQEHADVARAGGLDHGGVRRQSVHQLARFTRVEESHLLPDERSKELGADAGHKPLPSQIEQGATVWGGWGGWVEWVGGWVGRTRHFLSNERSEELGADARDEALAGEVEEGAAVCMGVGGWMGG